MFLNPSMFDNVYEPEVVPEGEYQLRVINAEDKKAQSGTEYVQVTLEVMDKPRAKNVYYNVFMPKADDDAKKVNNKLNSIKKFVAAFKSEITEGFTFKSLIGSTAWAILKEVEDGEYGNKNEVKRWL